jgi:hypothetical protein
MQEIEGLVQVIQQGLQTGVAGEEGRRKVSGAGQNTSRHTSMGGVGMLKQQICRGGVGGTGVLQQQKRQQKAGGGVGQSTNWQFRLRTQQQQQQQQQCLLCVLAP